MSDSLLAMEKGILLANWLRDDIFVVAKPLIKITKNLSDAVILSRIVWYFSPKKDGGGLKLRVKKDGRYWLVKAHEDWEDECGIPKGTAKDSIKRLKEQGYIEVEYHRFGGLRKIHIHICWTAIAEALGDLFPDPDDLNEDDSATTESISPEPRNDGIHLPATTESIRPATTESVDPLTSTNSSGINYQVQDQTHVPQQAGGACEVVNEELASQKKKGGKKPRPKADQIYSAIANLEMFEKFWVWYKDDFCSVTTHNGGHKAEAGEAWLKLEETNFFGVGPDGFRKGVVIQRKNRDPRGVGIMHACRFLAGGEKGEPDWLVGYRDASGGNKYSAKDFLSDSDGSPSVSLVTDSEVEIRRQHARLRQPGSQIIQGSGFTRPGVTTVWDILRNPSEAAEYLKWLRSQEPDDDEDEHLMAM